MSYPLKVLFRHGANIAFEDPTSPMHLCDQPLPSLLLCIVPFLHDAGRLEGDSKRWEWL